MARFLVWNVCFKNSTGKNVLDHIASLSRQVQADFVVLVECLLNSREVLQGLNSEKTPLDPTFYHSHSDSGNDYIRLYTNWPQMCLEPLTLPTSRLQKRLKAWAFETPGSSERYLLVAVHGPDIRNYPDQIDRSDRARQIMDIIRELEGNLKFAGTLITGDFNMNPYDPGMVREEAFHSMPSAKDAANKPQAYYNPMWSLMGDRTVGPPGTFYRNGQPAWHMLDQVLLSSSLAHALVDCRVCDWTPLGSLAKPRGTPLISDHFPLTFEIKLEGI